MKKKILSLTLAGFLTTIFCHSLYAETTISGAIEIVTVFNEVEDDTEFSVELGIDYQVSKKVDAHILFEYDEDERTFVDEAVIYFHFNDATDIVIGRQNVPFGRYDSNMISDPVTLDLGETKEEALVFAQKWGGVNSSVYLFKDKADGANNKFDNFGVDIAYENKAFSVGAGYISDVVNTAVAGGNIHAKINFGSASIVAEHNRLDDLDNVNPNASHLEFAYGLGGDKVIAATYQETSNAEVLDLPKEVYGIFYSMPVYKNTSISAEYLNTIDYDGVEDDAITLKLSYEF